MMVSNSSKSATTSARSILAMMDGFRPTSANSCLAWSISPRFDTKLTATKSGSMVAIWAISARSFSVRAGAARPPPSLLTPLREDSLPPIMTVHSTALAETSSTRSLSLPSSNNNTSSIATCLGSAVYSIPTRRLSPSFGSILTSRQKGSPAISDTEPSRKPLIRIFGP